MVIEKVRLLLFPLRLKFLKDTKVTREWIREHGCPKCGHEVKRSYTIHTPKCVELATQKPKKAKRIIQKNIKNGINPVTHCIICKGKLSGTKRGYSYSCSECGYSLIIKG